MDQLSQHIESLIFTSQGPITFGEIKDALQDSFDTKFKKAEIQSAIDEVLEKYKSDDFSFEIVEIANGFQFFTKGAFHGTVGSRLKLTSKKRLSKAALETLAVIAYKQPVVKSECEKIRGVSCDYTIQKLLEKELIAIAGRADTPGRPLLYSTSQKFMDYFGLKDISDLPKPKDFQLPDEEIGTAAPIEELSEEQRAEKTVALEAMTDEVAAAILGEDFFPKPIVEELESENPEAVSDDIDGEDEALENPEETEPEAAIDDEPEDSASEAPNESENVSAMSEEETAALLAADALIEQEDIVDDEVVGEEDVELEIEKEGEWEESLEEEELFVSEIEQELKEIREEEETVEEENLEEKEEIRTPVFIPTEKIELEEVSEQNEFSFENEIDAIASMTANLPESNTVIGLSEKELLSSQPIINKIVEEEQIEENTEKELDVTSDDIDDTDSLKKKI